MAITANMRRMLKRFRLTTDDVIQFMTLPLGDDGAFIDGTLVISAGDATKFKTTTIAVYSIAGLMYAKAATDALVFTAAHVVTALKHGAILVQINAAGTVSTLITGATQTTALAHNTAALAIAAVPAPATGNVALGYILIEADAGNWTALTDDMTDASDLTTAAFVDVTVKALAHPTSL